MPTVDVRPLARLALGCLAVVAVAWLALGRDGGDGAPVGDPEPTTSTTSLFGPVDGGGAGVVRTGGLVLPVLGGADGAWRVLTPCARETVVEGAHVPGAHVVIDPGHGGEETGAVGPSGVVEADVNLAVAGLAAERLADEGVTVVLTREDDTRVTIQTRAAIVEALQPDLFVSIHHNGGPTTPSDRPGVQVYHQHEAPESARFASLLFDQLQEQLTPLSPTWSSGNASGVRARLGTDGDDYYGVLREAGAVPAVLAEALYLSSEPEASLLLESQVWEAEAEAIVEAVRTWTATGQAGSGFLSPLVAAESAGGGGGTSGCEDPDGLDADG